MFGWQKVRKNNTTPKSKTKKTKMDNYSVYSNNDFLLEKQKNKQTNESKLLFQKLQFKKRQNRKNILLVSLLLLTIFLTYLAIQSIFGNSKSLYKLSFITQDSIYNTIEARALIVRQEFLLTSDIEGEALPLASEGTQLAYGTKISLVVKENIDQLQNQLQQVEKQIAKRQDRLIAMGEGKEANQIFARYFDQLSQQAKQIAQLKALGYYSGLNQIESYMKSLLEARSIRLNKLELTDVVLTDLLKEKDKLIRQIEEKSKTYYLPEPGIISYSYDNRETQLSNKNLVNLGFEKISELLSEKEQYQSALGAKDSDIIARLIAEPRQLLAFSLPNETAKLFVDKKTIDLFIPQENLDIDGANLLTRFSDDYNTIFIVETHTGLSNLLNKRFTPIYIKSKKAYGYKVPNESLEKINNGSEENDGFITIINNGRAKKIRVEILISNATDSIIKAKNEDEITFDLGSVVILDAQNINDGDEIE